jgi:hypothetical protein
MTEVMSMADFIYCTAWSLMMFVIAAAWLLPDLWRWRR